MLRRLIRPFSEVQDSFLKYIRKAEEIEQTARAREEAKEAGTKMAAAPTPKPANSVAALLQKLMTYQQLNNARSRERVQIILEEAFAAASLAQRKDPKSPVNVKALAEHMLFQWDDRPELRNVELSFSEIMRSILATPALDKLEYVGEFSRITKPAKQALSATLCGSFGNTVYLATVRGCAKVPFTGVKALRRTIDHMSAFDYTPSQEVILAVATECVEGKWPLTANAFMQHIINKKITVTTPAIANVVALLRRTRGNFELGLKLAEAAIESGSQPNAWAVMEPLVLKYLKHQMVKEATVFVENCARLLAKRKYCEDATEQGKKVAEAQAKMYIDMIKCLLTAQMNGDAFALYSKWLASDKSQEVISLALTLYERLDDTASAVKFLERIQKLKDFEVNRQTLVSILKIARNSKTLGVTMADSYMPSLLKQNVYSPFALNLCLMIYGTRNIKKVVELCSQVIEQSLHVNHFTNVTLSKILRNSPDGPEREELVKLFKAMRFPDPPQEPKKQAK